MKTKSTHHTHRLPLTVLIIYAGFAILPVGQARAAEDDAVNMIMELISGSDHDMRMLAIQQIREQIPGQDATRRFADMLPTLPTDVQIQLIDALGERGDTLAGPAIRNLLDSPIENIRAGAAGALASLGGPNDIPALAGMAANGTAVEKEAARDSLRRLRGYEMSTAMTLAMNHVDTLSKVELITALVDRNVNESAPALFKYADDPNLAVRLAVLNAFNLMADANDTSLVVKRLKSAQDPAERKRAALALMATCKRGQTKCADAVIAGLKEADAATSLLMMRALPEAGGSKALKEIVTRLKDQDDRISTEAVRILANWPDRTAMGPLKTLARDVTHQRNHILAIRGLVRLVGPGKDRKPDTATLSEIMNLATRRDEKVLVLGMLGTIPNQESLALVASALDQPSLAEDAGLAAMLIAEKIGQGNRDQVVAVMQKIIATVKSEKTLDRAKKVLEEP